MTPNTPSGYVTTNSTQITVPSTYDGTAYWQGEDEGDCGKIVCGDGTIKVFRGEKSIKYVEVEDL